MMRKNRAVGLAVLLAVGLAACGGGETATFAVDDVWARSTPNGLGAVYATFTTDQDDELVDAIVDASIAAVVELHEVINDDGVMRMRQVSGVPMVRGEERLLRPGDYHVMLLDMPQMLEPGETFTVTFFFASGRTLEAEAQVRVIEDDTMPHGHSMSDHGHSMTDADKDEPMPHGTHSR